MIIANNDFVSKIIVKEKTMNRDERERQNFSSNLISLFSHKLFYKIHQIISSLKITSVIFKICFLTSLPPFLRPSIRPSFLL